MEKKISVMLTLTIFVLLAFSVLVSAQAITAALQGAKIALYAEVGEELERSILVINRNDITIGIILTVTGDLESTLKILREKEFDLAPGEERKVRFTIKAKKPGITETRINVQFIPPSGNGVGLPSIIRFDAKGEAEETSEEDLEEDFTEDEEDSQVSFNPSVKSVTDEESKSKASPMMILSISTGILIAVLIGLVFYTNKKRHKRGARRPSA